MSKIYIAIWKDSHSDTTAHPFSNKQKAIEWAKEKANEYCRFPEDYEENDITHEDGQIFSVEYSCESDSICVVEKEIDQDL